MPTVLKRRSRIRDDLTVALYPTFGYLDAERRTWNVRIRGSVYEPGPDTLRGRILQRLLQRMMKAEPHELESEIYRRRIGGFLVRGERGRRIRVRIGARTYILRRKSRGSGHFGGTLHLSVDEVNWLKESGQVRNGWLQFDVAAQGGDDRPFPGRAQLIGPTGTSVISDIDDTIKHSDVTRRGSLLKNTFLREFQWLPEMASLYSDWADEGAVFHYVSSSPWQLYGSLAELCGPAGFPEGTFHLRLLRLRDPNVFRLLLARRLGKRRMIRSIVRAFPDRRFVLVGDSGERDPEVYGSVARKFPGQVARILIRKVDGRPMDNSRCRKAFRQFPDASWHVFSDTSQLS